MAESKVVVTDEEKLGEMIDPNLEPAPETETESEPEPAPETETEPTPESEPAPAPVENHDIRRMRKFMQRAYDAEAQLAAVRAAQQPAQPVQPAESTEIKRENYQTDEQYLAAATERAITQVRQAAQQEIEQRRQAEIVAEFQKKADAARKEIEDYDDVINASTVIIPPALQNIILSSEYSARLAYEIVKDDQYAEQLAAMSPLAAAKAIGKLEAKLEAEKKPAAAVIKPVSKAPAPIKAVSSKGTEVKPDPQKMSTEEWIRWRRKQKYGV